MGCTRYGAVAGACLLLVGLGGARAADVETRTFSIEVDGKKSGDYHMVITRQDDGSVSLSAQSDVRVTVLAIPVYTYSYRAVEVWKNGRLQHFQSSGKESGKAFTVTADVNGSTLRVQANGQERQAPLDVWTTSVWRLPPAAYRNNQVTLLGCCNGLDKPSRLDYIGAEQIKVAGQVQSCTHYRVMKDELHDVWYDAQERVVRDEWTSSGHHTVLELTGMRR